MNELFASKAKIKVFQRSGHEGTYEVNKKFQKTLSLAFDVIVNMQLVVWYTFVIAGFFTIFRAL